MSDNIVKDFMEKRLYEEISEGNILEANIKLVDENKYLKEQIIELQEQVEKLKQKVNLLKKYGGK